jgi:hypothetical protein
MHPAGPVRPSPLAAGRHDRDRLRGGAARPDTEPVIGAAFGVTLARAQGSDGTAFACLFRDVQPALLRYLQVLTLEAEDVASDIWLQVVRGLADFREPSLGLSQKPQVRASGPAASPYGSRAERCRVPILSSPSATGLTRPPQLPLAARSGRTG